MKLSYTLLNANAKAPQRMTAHSAGFDLSACLDSPLLLAAGARALIPTGIAIAVPVGHEAQVRPRSGLAHKHGLTILNSPGTIDADYRGEVKIVLHNSSNEDFTVENGMRIAQLVVCPIAVVELEYKASLDDTDRGEAGFGHTGI